MDFIARAGSIVDRSHRMSGILLLLVMLLSAMAVVQFLRNVELNRQIQAFSERRPVYVIPGATQGMYSPTEDELLIRAFADQVSQAFNTFTYENIRAQYENMKPFFTAEMLTFSQTYFEKLVADSGVDRRSSLFIPDHQTLRIEKDGDIRNVTIRGSLQTILAGSVVESVPVELSLRLRKVIFSPANPFGLQLASYSARRLETARAATQGSPAQ